MRPVRTLVIFILAAFVGGALLAPWLYWLAQWVGSRASALAFLSVIPFHRFVARAVLALALAGMWPFLRSLGARSWAAAGLTSPAGQWRRVGMGFLLGFATLALVAVLALACGARELDGGPGGNWRGKVPAIALAAVGVAVIEEILYRGVLFGALRRVHGWKTALVASSAAYAILHLIQPGKSLEHVSWSSGLEMLPQMLRGSVDPNLLVPGFFTLALAGMTLALAYQRTGRLWFSIGLHTGWVFWLKSYNIITDSVPGAARHFWGSGKLYDGWLAFLLMAAAAAVVWKFSGQTRSPEAAPALPGLQPDMVSPRGCASFSNGAQCPPGAQ